MSEVASGLSNSGPKAVSRGNHVRRYFVVGWSAIVLVFGGLIIWSVFAPFEGAVLTSGQIAVETHHQTIQHLEGGIVREIYVHEADKVEAGQKLISLDATMADAGLQALEARLFELLGSEARLIAERDDTSGLNLRIGFDDIAGGTAMASILAAQKNLRAARKSSRSTQTKILEQRIQQLSTRIGGMTREIASKDTQILLLDDEIARFEELMARGNTTVTRILALKRDRSRLVGEKEALISDIAATQVR
jgi:multidrug efflux pump subunit AcrA (membrane-fusion protein)